MKKSRIPKGRRLLIIFLSFTCFTGAGGRAGNGSAAAEQLSAEASADNEPAGYHTPLAGEKGRITFLGEEVLIPARDRGRLTSLTVGGSVLEPGQGGTRALPIAALFHRRVGEDARTRAMISLFVNELEYDKSLGPWELAGHFENYTPPTDQTVVVDNREMKETSLDWGTLAGSLGPGLRLPVSPFQMDNHARLQLLGRLGYFYADRTDHTGARLEVPPDTLLYGVRLRGRYDGMRRNLLELPHLGVAGGWDLDYLHRNKWRDQAGGSAGYGDRNYLQLSGYFVGAGGIPGLSERDRLLIALYGGKTGEKGADRFNAFRINGGPFPSEEGDLGRPRYTGILYDHVLATSYATASLGYRRELLFFLYLTMVGSYLWADRASVEGVDQVVFRDERGGAATVSLDSAFLWNSSIYLAYSWESGFIRGGKSGSGIALIWNKPF